MKNTDSLLTAAKKAAEGAGLPWAALQPYYKNLQEGDGSPDSAWLPKSLGRNIWYAHQNYISRLLIGFAASSNPLDACASVKWTVNITPNGRPFAYQETEHSDRLSAIEGELFKFLSDVETAENLLDIEVHADTQQIFINTKSGGRVVFRRPGEAGAAGGGASRTEDGIYRRGVIKGAVFVHLAKTVVWRRDDEAPLSKVEQGQVSESE
jgi:hypothetical protein